VFHKYQYSTQTSQLQAILVFFYKNSVIEFITEIIFDEPAPGINRVLYSFYWFKVLWTYYFNYCI